MRGFIQILENIWISVAFAEAGELKTAQEFMGPVLFEAESAETCQAV